MYLPFLPHPHPPPQSQGSFLRLYYPSCDATDNEEAPWIPDKEYYQGLSDFLNMYRVVGERLFQYYVGKTCFGFIP